jgi:hypothetical protein
MHAPKMREIGMPPALCAMCGMPLDAEYFDESGDAAAPPPGQDVVLARFELPPQYCGVLQYFAQFTDLHARDPARIDTPGLEWMILSNNRPLYPYIKLERIVNLWGYGGFPIAIRLDENATIEFLVRGVRNASSLSSNVITAVAGRIVGRYWYNAAYGDVIRRGF